MDAQIAYAVNQIIAHEGKISISHLMSEVNLCQRHFERKFKLHTGFTPQKYNSIVKFKNAIKILRNESSDNLLSVAVKAGYYDASFIKRSKKLSGSTPNFFYHCHPIMRLLSFIQNKKSRIHPILVSYYPLYLQH